MTAAMRYLLLQVRDAHDPMLQHEVDAFCAALACDRSRVATVNVLKRMPQSSELDSADVVLIGGSGDYSATSDAPWLDRTCELLCSIHARRQPMFGSCWGFQALAKAFGGQVVHDLNRAELGTLKVALTDAGKADPVFGPLGDEFHVPVGHEDTVTLLPANCTLIGQTAKAFHILRVDDAPIYATQFHPELDRDGLLERIRRYPKYVMKIRGMTFEEFESHCHETPKMCEILPRFMNHVMG